MTPSHVVVAGTRRAWSTEEKRAMLAEARDATSISAVARRHGVHASLLFRWRRNARAEEQAPTPRPSTIFVPLALPAPTSVPEPTAGVIEIEVAGGHRVRVEPGADPALLRDVIAALVGR